MTNTILGAGGFAGIALAHELRKRNVDVRLVSRSQHPFEGAEVVKGDLSVDTDTVAATKGSETAFLCVGLPYDSRIWEELWPRVMRNVIEACKQAQARLIFFDNVYMYGKVSGLMTEETPYNPCSKKGEIRAKVATMLEDEMKRGNLRALIARSADVYGPHAGLSSIPHILVFDKVLKGKKAQWLIDARKAHSFTFTTDCAEGMWLLANQEDTFGQIWHLPTAHPPIDGETFIELTARELGIPPNYSLMKKPMLRLAGIFSRTIFELIEMVYQCDSEYRFDSSKFERRFGYTPKPYAEGIRETLQFLKAG